MFSHPHPMNIMLYGYGVYLVEMFIFLCVAVGLHEIGHIIFAKYHHLEYEILFENGNFKIAADWEAIGKNKIYGNILGVIFGLPIVIVAGLFYPALIFFVVYMVACYDDLKAVAIHMESNI